MGERSTGGRKRLAHDRGHPGQLRLDAEYLQAKRRVEKANRTLQDRLIKEMRLRKINTIEEANRYLPEFIAEWNNRFVVTPASSLDMHRKRMPSDDELELLFSLQEIRKVSKNLQISYDNTIYQMKSAIKLRHKYITICQTVSGEMTFLDGNKPVDFIPVQRAVKAPKVMTAKELQAKVIRPKAIRTGKEPWRGYVAISKENVQLPTAHTSS